MQRNKKEKLSLWLEAIEDDKPYIEGEDEEMEDAPEEPDSDEVEDAGEDAEEDEEEYEDEPEEVEEGDEEDFAIINEAKQAPKMTREHFVFLIDFIVDLLSMTNEKGKPILTNKPITVGNDIYNAVLDKTINTFARTNPAFDEATFKNKFKAVFNSRVEDAEAVDAEAEKAAAEIDDATGE